MKIFIINGPNLNLLGTREPDLYGNTSFDDYLQTLRQRYPETEIEHFQSNIEGEIINKIQETGFSNDGIILNAAAYTHTSVAIGDAVKAVPAPVIEVHISNVYNRETFRHLSFISPNASGVIVGMGLAGYQLAIEYLINIGKQ